MAHVELSLSEAFVPPTTASREQGSDNYTEADDLGGPTVVSRPAASRRPTDFGESTGVNGPGDRGEPADRNGLGGVARWSNAVSSAEEPCLLIARDTTITAASLSCCALLGLGTPANAVGQALLSSELRLLDFTAARGELTEQDVEKIPPLLALASGRLARGLLRVQCGGVDESDSTIDAIATPLLVRGAVAGSLTFFAEV